MSASRIDGINNGAGLLTKDPTKINQGFVQGLQEKASDGKAVTQG